MPTRYGRIRRKLPRNVGSLEVELSGTIIRERVRMTVPSPKKVRERHLYPLWRANHYSEINSFQCPDLSGLVTRPRLEQAPCNQLPQSFPSATPSGAPSVWSSPDSLFEPEASLRVRPGWWSGAREARRAGAAGRVSLGTFLPRSKKVPRPPGRDPAIVNPQGYQQHFGHQHPPNGLALPSKRQYDSALSCFARVSLRARSLR